MRKTFAFLLAVLGFAFAAAAFAASPGLPSTQVAWLPAAADADVDRAFARARSEHKPLLLYWGASWCPPCNQLKATLFNRQDFAALSKGFVAVHVDGDRPGAQKIGARFGVSGYPTMVLFDPQGAELTRLPGEVDPPQVMAVLQLALAAGDWRLLAFHSWDTEDAQRVSTAERPALLARLATAAADARVDDEIATRLWLKALAASDDGKGLKADDALRARVLRVLADPAAVRAQTDLLTGSAAEIVRVLEDELSPRRPALVAAYDRAMQRLQGDATLSRADRLGALLARIELARLELPEAGLRPALPAPLFDELRAQVARDDREIRDGYERQAVITGAAYVLGRAGLWDDSDALLKANLGRSHSPYYLMSQLAGNARKLGRNDEALRWSREAWEKSQGPATRLQWGAGYLASLIDLAPADAARIEAVAAQLLREAAQDSGAFEGRSARTLRHAGSQLGSWNADGRHAAVLGRLQRQLDGVCRRAPAAERAACSTLLKPAARKDA